MPKKKTKAKPKSEPPFEESLAELEAIVGDLEGGELGLADALGRYEEGVKRLKACHGQLDAAERRIELLSGVDAEGQPVTTPFDAEASAQEPTAAGRSRKRTAKRAPERGGGGVDDRTRLF